MDPLSTARTYTPMDASAVAMPTVATNPFGPVLNTGAGAPIVTPVWGLLLVGLVVLLLERRRLRIGGR